MRAGVTLTVDGVTDPELFTRTVEAFGRAMAGLALEGIEPMMYVSNQDDTED